MGFGFGTGFLNTDPRSKKNPKGGSISASQDTDTSVMNTGDISSGSMGFGSKSAFTGGGMFEKIEPKPATPGPMTASETTAQRESKGVASSHQNMGSLAVDFRASEKVKSDAGQQTIGGAREAKILKERADREYQRTVTAPAEAEQAKFRAQAAGAQKFMGKFMANAESDAASAMSSMSPRSNSGRSSGLLIGSKRLAKSSKGLGLDSKQSGKRSGFSDLTPRHGKTSNQLTSDFRTLKENPDVMALAAQRAHAAAPGTQAVDWMDMANAQSASGKATPSQMAQAAVSMHARETPNK
jgi:hypothetical protein